VVFLDMHD